jgi:hypothetical protein
MNKTQKKALEVAALGLQAMYLLNGMDEPEYMNSRVYRGKIHDRAAALTTGVLYTSFGKKLGEEIFWLYLDRLDDPHDALPTLRKCAAKVLAKKARAPQRNPRKKKAALKKRKKSVKKGKKPVKRRKTP